MPQQITLIPLDEAVEEKKRKPTTGELVKGAWAKAMPFGLPISETISHLATGGVGAVGGLVGFGAKLLADLVPGGEKPSFARARETMGGVSEALTYKPQTPEAQKMTRVTLVPLELAAKGIKGGSELITSDPEVQAGIQTAGDLGLFMLMGKAAKGFKQPEIGAKFKPVTEAPTPKFVEEPINPTFEKFGTLFKEFRKGQKEQAVIYSKERGARLGEGLEAAEGKVGQEYFDTIKSKMGGKIERVPFKHDFTPGQTTELYDGVKGAVFLTNWEKLQAARALDAVFKEGTVPAPADTALLARAYGKSFVKSMPRNIISEIANIPRSMMASGDLSFGLRQGMPLGAGYPKEFARAMAEQVKYFGSEGVYQGAMKEIAQRPTYQLMRGGPGRRVELALTEMGPMTGLREEKYLSPIAEKIPGIGPIIRASGRAYTGGLNKLRADVFDSKFHDAEAAGFNPAQNPMLLDAMCDFINKASGRGSAKPLANSTQLLNALFFSPRLVLSRLQMIGKAVNLPLEKIIHLANPDWWTQTPKPVRIATLRTLLGFAGMLTTTAGLLKLAGAEVSLDARSSDFLKPKFGNTRIDLGAGFLQYIRTFVQLLTGQVVSTRTGKITEVGEGYKPLTRWDIAERMVEYKTAPIPSFVINLLRGKSVFGEKLNIPKEVLQRLTPMVWQDLYDIAKDDPKLLPLGVLGVFGAGLQTYEPSPKKSGSLYFYTK